MKLLQPVDYQTQNHWKAVVVFKSDLRRILTSVSLQVPTHPKWVATEGVLQDGATHPRNDSDVLCYFCPGHSFFKFPCWWTICEQSAQICLFTNRFFHLITFKNVLLKSTSLENDEDEAKWTGGLFGSRSFLFLPIFSAIIQSNGYLNRGLCSHYGNALRPKMEPMCYCLFVNHHLF